MSIAFLTHIYTQRILGSGQGCTSRRRAQCDETLLILVCSRTITVALEVGSRQREVRGKKPSYVTRSQIYTSLWGHSTNN
jgi:hypothetical protein